MRRLRKSWKTAWTPMPDRLLPGQSAREVLNEQSKIFVNRLGWMIALWSVLMIVLLVLNYIFIWSK